MVDTPEYEFIVRDLRTLAFVGELGPIDLITASWTRRDVAGGSFSLSIPRSLVSSLDLIAPHSLLVIRRDGVDEFVGVIEYREIDALGLVWTLQGPELLAWWLGSRLVGEAAPDDRSGIAEDVIVAYVRAYLGDTASAARQASTALTGLSWSVQASSGRGLAVVSAATRRPLSDVIEATARDGNIVPSLAILPDFTGFEFRCASPVDATAGAGNVPFAVDWDNVEALVYAEDYRPFWNHLYVMGSGSAGSRNYSEVEDSDSVTTHFRREGVIDARYASTAGQREAVGASELLRREKALVVVRATPFRASGLARYRVDWDVGWDVTFSESELRSEPLDVRVVAATVSLVRAVGEYVTFELGQFRADDRYRRLEDAVRQLRIAAME